MTGQLAATIGAILLSLAGTTLAAEPYTFPIALPPPLRSPPTDPAAPYTPAVRRILDQLLPGDRPTPDQIRAASALISSKASGTPGANSTCHNQATAMRPRQTLPKVMPLCFTDGLGINVLTGPNVDRTTGFPSIVALAASFNLDLANAMGQATGREGRALMVTGFLGPQTDTDIFVNWMRGHHTPGEDPYLNGLVTAAQVNGMQGAGLMAQVKHFAGYNGTTDNHLATIQDQAFHELLLTPYELAITRARPSSIMCSYQRLRIASGHLPADMPVLAGEPQPRTWPLGEAHYACEQPVLLNYVLRHLWGATLFVGSDYGGVHSAAGFLQGDDREEPAEDHFGPLDPGASGKPGFAPLDGVGQPALDPTGDSCADAGGRAIACSAPDARQVAGIPGPGCPLTGCGIANAVANGTVPLPVFKQALARILYQIERFGMLGCDNDGGDCANPGGVGADRSGTAALPAGDASGPIVPGTRAGDAAIAEQVAEQGAVLLKNAEDESGLPIRPADLAGGIAVSGGGAEYLIANPNNEGSVGFAERNAISPLAQLRAQSGRAAVFGYTPARSPTGQTIACAATRPDAVGAAPNGGGTANGLTRTSSIDERGRVETDFDHTVGSKAGQLAPGALYRWAGAIFVAPDETTVFRVQHDATLPDGALRFWLDEEERSVVDAQSFYHGQYYGAQPVPVGWTNAGYVEPGLRNRQCATPPTDKALGFGPPPADAAANKAGAAAKPLVTCPTRLAPGWHRLRVELDARTARAPVSFRLAWSRTNHDIADAAADAAGRAMAIVFVNDEGRNTLLPFPAPDQSISSLPPEQIALVRAVAARNPNTVVVLNTGTPIVTREWIGEPGVKAVLNLWHAGQEGGTATARLLLGLANPSGHTTITWPIAGTDTIQLYDQPKPLYPGDTTGRHPERADGDLAATHA